MSDTPDTPEAEEDAPKVPHGPTISIEQEMKTSYLDYAMSVIISRAIPDLRDGLKPVHRRILWAMHESGNTHDKSYRKSARPVRGTMRQHHPHRAHPRGHARGRQPPRQVLPQVRPARRRHHGQVSPPRRLGDLRRARAHG